MKTLDVPLCNICLKNSKAWRNVVGVLSGAGTSQMEAVSGGLGELRFLPHENNYSHKVGGIMGFVES